MGLLTPIKRVAVSFLVVFNWAYAFLSRRYKIHRARFARIDELARLMTESLDHEASLILGISHLNILRVKPVKTRRELGNLLVVAPTRGGKGLLATSQLLTWKHSVIVNDIKGDLFAQTAGYFGLDRHCARRPACYEVGSEGMVSLPISPKWIS